MIGGRASPSDGWGIAIPTGAAGAQRFFCFAASSRRASSASIASRMKRAMPLSPTSSRIRSLTSSEIRTFVDLFPSGGRPIGRELYGAVN
jgi:hypothetical protein